MSWILLGLTVALLSLVVLAEMVPRLLELPDQLASRRTIEHALFVLDDAAGYVMQPHYTGRWSAAEYDQPFQTNERGLRGPELQPKQFGEFRIVVIGDSIVFGGQVPEQQRFTELLEAALKARGYTQVRVVNVGIPGWTTFNEAGFLRANAAWLQPDLVVLAVYLGNDVEENVMATLGGYMPDSATGIAYGLRTREVVQNSAEWFPHNFQVGATEHAPPHLEPSDWKPGDSLPKPAANTPTAGLPATEAGNAVGAYVASSGLDAARTWLKENSRLYAEISNGWFSLGHGFSRPMTLSLAQWLAFTLRDEPPQFWLQVGYPLTAQYLAQAHDATAAAGARMIALLIPHEAQVAESKRDAELGRFHLTPDQVDLDRPQREVSDALANQGVETIDLLPALRSRDDRAELTYQHDLHLTPLGHSAVAQVLANELVGRGTLPAPQTPG